MENINDQELIQNDKEFISNQNVNINENDDKDLNDGPEHI